ncbi:MAG: chemotaxis protein [Pseudomonas sp.]|nr:chemotaxis protein [Pseudomonas sp.]
MAIDWTNYAVLSCPGCAVTRLRRWRMKSLMHGDIGTAERFLRDNLRLDPRFELFYLVGRDGVQISDNIFAEPNAKGEICKGRNWSQRPWFKAVAERLSSHITPVYRSSATDAFCFTVSVPVFTANGQLHRVLAADIRLSALV